MSNSRNYLIAVLILLCLSAKSANATLIQILHTNDLHAAMETFGAPNPQEQEYGGWAQLKATMDGLTSDASAHGIETIKLDAGDYTEGSSFYFSDHGKNVIRAFQHLGYDATAMGNHDWLMGADAMEELYRDLPFPFPVLSANTKITRRLPNLSQQIQPTTQIVKSGIKIGIFGLSTDEQLYSWIPSVESRKRDMRIKDYRDEVFEDDSEAGTRIVPGIANTMIQRLRAENDVVIGLTHIGYEEDKMLAANSEGLDLIVGGHSHTFLQTPTLIQDRDGKDVPIVQTGFNGKYIGKIILDVREDHSVKLISYDLIPVLNQSAKDPVMESLVKNANGGRKSLFGNRLNEVIGTSDERLVSGDAGPTAFSKFVVDSMRDVTGAEVAIDVGAFHGNTPQPAGPVTRLNLMEMYPRKFESDQNEGLYIYEASVPGLILKIGLDYAVRFGMYVGTSGLTYDLGRLSDYEYAKLRKQYAGTVDENIVTPFFPMNIKVGGYPLKSLHWYDTVAPESLVRGAWGITSLSKLVLRRGHATAHTIWDAMNFYLLKTGKIPAMARIPGPNPWSPEIHSPRSMIGDIVRQSLTEMPRARDALTTESPQVPTSP
jgi:2',3'-cyclic-nucleotide 2'-phosphodiesterase (5'-nucleotidase family)